MFDPNRPSDQSSGHRNPASSSSGILLKPHRFVALGLVASTALIAMTGCFSSSLYKGKPAKNVKTLLADKACQSCELSGVDLSGADLQNADLRGANLWEANLTGANLQGANLEDASLAQANLTGADLQGANFTRTSFNGSNLAEANLQGTDLSGAGLPNVSFRGANLAGANLTNARYNAVDLTGANLKDVVGFDLASLQASGDTSKVTLDSATILPDGSTYASETGGEDSTAVAQDTAPPIAKKLSDLQLRAACQGEAVAGAIPYDADNLAGRQDILRAFSTQMAEPGERQKAYIYDFKYLSDQPRWLNDDNPALVLCAKEVPQAELIETCPYEENTEVRRYYSELELKLVETATGAAVATQTFGQEADACPSGERFRAGETVKNYQVTYFDQTFEADISQFVQPHIEQFQ